MLTFISSFQISSFHFMSWMNKILYYFALKHKIPSRLTFFLLEKRGRKRKLEKGNERKLSKYLRRILIRLKEGKGKKIYSNIQLTINRHLTYFAKSHKVTFAIN